MKLAKKKHSSKCPIAYCRNQRAAKTYKKSKYKLPYCWKCKSRKLKENHPSTYYLNIIRGSAKKRKIPFSITTDEFRDWCDKHDMINRKGHKAGMMTVDRIDADKGYTIDNIQPLEFIENSSKDNNPF